MANHDLILLTGHCILYIYILFAQGTDSGSLGGEHPIKLETQNIIHSPRNQP